MMIAKNKQSTASYFYLLVNAHVVESIGTIHSGISSRDSTTLRVHLSKAINQGVTNVIRGMVGGSVL